MSTERKTARPKTADQKVLIVERFSKSDIPVVVAFLIEQGFAIKATNSSVSWISDGEQQLVVGATDTRFVLLGGKPLTEHAFQSSHDIVDPIPQES